VDSRHGGHIIAHSAGDGRGATFMLRMPAVPRTDQAGTTAEADVGRAEGPGNPFSVSG